MNHDIGGGIGWKLPKIVINPARNNPFVDDSLIDQLGIEFPRIPDRENNPTPALIQMELEKKIPTDESGGACQKELHGSSKEIGSLKN